MVWPCRSITSKGVKGGGRAATDMSIAFSTVAFVSIVVVWLDRHGVRGAAGNAGCSGSGEARWWCMRCLPWERDRPPFFLSRCRRCAAASVDPELRGVWDSAAECVLFSPTPVWLMILIAIRHHLGRDPSARYCFCSSRLATYSVGSYSPAGHQ